MDLVVSLAKDTRTLFETTALATDVAQASLDLRLFLQWRMLCVRAQQDFRQNNGA